MSQDVQGMLIQIEATTAQLRRELASADQVVARTTQQIDRNLTTVDSAFDRTARGAQQAGQLIRGAFAALAGAGLVGSIIKQADAVGQMADRMRAATDDSREYDMVQKRLMQTAQETYRPLQEAQELYIRTADAIKGLGYNTQQTLDITDSFSYLLVTNAASADKASGALDAYSKALNTGKVEADGWSTILAAMPTVVESVAAATGKSAGEIRRLGAEGKLALDDLNAGLLDTLQANRQAAADMTVSVNDALVNIGNAAQDYIGRLNETSGATDSLAESLKVIADNIDVVAAVIGGVAAGALAVYTRAAALAAVETAKGIRTAVADRAARIAQADAVLQAAIADQRKAQTATILAQREAEAARGTAVQTQMSIQLAQARQREAAATAAVTAAQTGLRQASTGVLAMLGGPMGIAMLAGSAAAAFLLMRDGSDEARVSLDDLALSVEEYGRKWAEAGAEQRRAMLVDARQQLGQVQQDLNGAITEIEKAFYDRGPKAGQPFGDVITQLGELRSAAQDGAGVDDIVQALLDGVPAGDSFRAAVEQAAGRVADHAGKQTALNERISEYTDRVDDNTRAQRENATAAAAAAQAGDKYIAQLQQRLNTLQDKTALNAANRFIAENTGLTAEQIARIRELASAQDAQREAEARATAGRKASKSSIDEQLRAIDAVIDRALPERKRLEDLTKAQGDLRAAHAAGKVTAAELEQGLKNLNKQYEDPAIRKAEELQKKVNAELKRQRDAVQGVLDRLDPLAAATRVYADEQAMLREALERGDITLGQYETSLAALGKEYQRNSGQVGLWAELTEGALDRIDGAFADMWGAVLSGSKSTLDQLKAAMLQTLAEMAHAAITKPIIMQIGAALGIGGSTGQAVSMMGGSAGSGGLDAFGLLRNGYSIANSGFGQAVAQGWGNGGFSGAISSGWNYGSNALGSFFGSGAANSGGSAITDYTGAQFGNWVGAQNAAATTWGSAATGMGAIAGGLSGAYMGYQRSGIKGAVAGGLGGWGGGTLGTMAGAAAASALSGTAMGAALGSVLPGIGTVIGAALGAAFGSKLFAGEWEQKAAGIALSGANGDFLGQEYIFSKKSGGLFGSNKKKTEYSEMDATLARALGKRFDEVTENALTIFDSFGFDVGESALDGLNVKKAHIRTDSKKKQEQLQENIDKWFGTVGNASTNLIGGGLVSGFASRITEATSETLGAALEAAGAQLTDKQMQGLSGLSGAKLTKKLSKMVGAEVAAQISGSVDEARAAVFEQLTTLDADMASSLSGLSGKKLTAELEKLTGFGKNAYESLAELAGKLEAVNATFELLNLSVYESSLGGAKLAEDLVAIAGGLESLATSTQTYYDAFFSAEEKLEDTINGIKGAFEDADLELAGSRDAYREMVEDIDRTTEAGQEMFATMMALSGQAAQYYSIVEQQAAEALAKAQAEAAQAAAVEQARIADILGAVSNAFTQVQRSIAAEQQSLNAEISATTGNISALASVGNSLDAAIKRLRGSSDDTVRSLRAQAVMTLNSALVTARSGGSLAQFAGLQDALDVASDMDAALYGSLEDFEREQGRTANLIAELERVNGKQLSAEEQALEHYQQQSAQLDEQLAFAQAQVDALNGIDSSVLSVADAVAAMNAAVVTALGVLANGLAPKNTAGNNAALVESVYKDLFGRDADAAGSAYWQDRLKNGTANYADLADQMLGGAKAGDVSAAINAAYQKALGRNADAAGAAWYASQIASGAIKASDLEKIIKGGAIGSDVPGFASGGFTGYGSKDDPAGIVHKGEVVWSQADIAKWGGAAAVEAMRMGGPQLTVSGPSRIRNAYQAAANQGDSVAEVVAEVRALRGVVSDQGNHLRHLRDIALSSEETRKAIRLQNEVGVPAWSG